MKKFNNKFVAKTNNAAIRKLYDEGHSIAEIAKGMGLRYQRVRNVIKPALKPRKALDVTQAKFARRLTAGLMGL